MTLTQHGRTSTNTTRSRIRKREAFRTAYAQRLNPVLVSSGTIYVAKKKQPHDPISICGMLVVFGSTIRRGEVGTKRAARKAAKVQRAAHNLEKRQEAMKKRGSSF